MSLTTNQDMQRQLMALLRDGLMDLMRQLTPDLTGGYSPLADALAKVLAWQRDDAVTPSTFAHWDAVYTDADACYAANAPWLQEPELPYPSGLLTAVETAYADRMRELDPTLTEAQVGLGAALALCLTSDARLLQLAQGGAA